MLQGRALLVGLLPVCLLSGSLCQSHTQLRPPPPRPSANLACAAEGDWLRRACSVAETTSIVSSVHTNLACVICVLTGLA